MIEIKFAPRPAIPEYFVYSCGNKHLLDENQKRHSYNDLPAMVYPSGHKRWYKHGQLHRDNDLPAIIHSNGTKQYWINGERIK